MTTYPIELTPDDNGTLLVTCPALPEVSTFGTDEADAHRRSVDAINEAIAARLADGREVPMPVVVCDKADIG
jgi:antitoxin HicB